jgi:hypothetical protein
MNENKEAGFSRRAVIGSSAATLVGLIAGTQTGIAQTMSIEPADTTSRLYTTDDGLRITSIEVEPNDVADILGIKLFHFKIELPRSGLRLRTKMEMRHGAEVVETPFKVTGQLITGTSIEAKAGLYTQRLDDGNFSNVLTCWSRVGRRDAISGGMGKPDGYDSSSISIIPSVEKDGSIELMSYSKSKDAEAAFEARVNGKEAQKLDEFFVVLTIQIA